MAKDGRLLGVIHLKDIVKGGIRERFAALRQMGIRTVMITGDKRHDRRGHRGGGRGGRLPRPGDAARPSCSSSATSRRRASWSPCAATAPTTPRRWPRPTSDVAMNTGTMAAREAGNMVDLDSDPTKLIEIVEIGKQL
ncbi:HAD family hydrolase [Azospirillum thermophilum]|uniref:HAD family hydrolase n=1 Tax=Azospirillum thermophilum TaxID=2202148 RepID=UPI001FE5A7C5